MSATSAEHSSFLTKMFAEGVTNSGALAENKTSRQGVTALTVHSGRVKDRDAYEHLQRRLLRQAPEAISDWRAMPGLWPTDYCHVRLSLRSRRRRPRSRHC